MCHGLEGYRRSLPATSDVKIATQAKGKAVREQLVDIMHARGSMASSIIQESVSLRQHNCR